MLPLALLSLATAGPPAPPIVGGSETTAWPAVGMVVGYDGDVIVPFCTGVLVGGRWALTAAHCILDSGADLQAEGFDLYFRVGPSVLDAPDAFVEIQTATTHPDYGGGPMSRGDDAAVLELAETIDTPPLAVSRDTVDGSLVGTEITYVGYGLTGTLAEDPGIARTVDATVSAVDEWVIETADINHGPCDGDSGGPLILGGAVIGLSSYLYTSGVGDTICEQGTAAGTRIDRDLEWIETITGTLGKEGPDDSGATDDTGDSGATDDSGDSGSIEDDSGGPGDSDSAAPIDSATPSDTGTAGAATAADSGCSCGSTTAPRTSSAWLLAGILAFVRHARRAGALPWHDRR